jgi:hypothetical protein
MGELFTKFVISGILLLLLHIIHIEGKPWLFHW